MLRSLDKYELLEEIGHGGMATVYRGRDTRLDRFVAVKVLHPHLQKTPEARSRFTREAKSVAKLRHGNILEIYDYSGDGADESYIAAELLSGPTLKALIEERGALPAEVAAAFTIQIARALDAAHAAKIVHRDVKPENVLLHGNRLKLTDFGIAQMVDSQSMTATGQILGSPGHMAPEQVAAGDVDERSDIFSLGTVLYYLATGRLPFEGRNPHQVLKRIVDGDYAPPLRMNPTMGADLSAIIDHALALEPSERPTSASAFEGELQRYLLGLDIDDADALVKEYLGAPAEVAARLKDNALAVLLARAKRLVEQKDRASALGALNRVLALDDGNTEALALVERLGKEGGSWRWVVLALALVAVGSLGAYALVSEPETVPTVDGGVPPVADAGPVDQSVPDSPAPAQDLGANVPEVQDAARPRDAGRRSDTRGRTMRARGPRLVRFDPRPQGVSISVDGGPFRNFGPRFRSVELTPGRHSFRMIGAAECCNALEFTENIPAGSGEYVLRRSLEYRDASLLISVPPSRMPATVTVARSGNIAGASGRAGAVFTVPMGALNQRRTIVVRGDDGTNETRQLTLRAGQLVSERMIQ